jgi:plastocyanin
MNLFMEDENKTATNYGKRPLWQWVVLYVVVAVAIYGLVYYFVLAKRGGGYNNPAAVAPTSAPTAMQPAPSQAPATGSAMTVSAQKITVVGTEFAFNPSTITLKKGQPAEITFKNNGTYPHNLSITDLGVKTKTIQPGEQDVVQFTPDKTGQFAFLCTVPGHADKGMKGTLTVQ